MTTAREIIATTYIEGRTEPVGPLHAQAILAALAAAGFRILGPDEVDQLERIAKGDIPGVWQEKFEKAQDIARAIGRKA